MEVFRFKRFEVVNEASPMKVNSDGVLLGAAVPLGKDTRRVLDVGTGTGTVALIVAQRLEELGCPDFMIEGIDIDPAAASEASFNFSRSPWKENLGSTCVSLSGYVPGTPVDLIVSNPPYFVNSLKNPDARRTLARHTDSLSFDDLFPGVGRLLSEYGVFSIIIPTDALEQMLLNACHYGFYVSRQVAVKTVERKLPKRYLLSFRRQPTECVVKEIKVMTDSEESRSTWFDALTREFYL